jgi:hypothetical protein
MDISELPAAVSRLATQRAVADYAAALARAASDLATRQLPEAFIAARPAVLARVRPAFDAEVSALIEAAAKLPAGSAALDPASVLETHTSRDYDRARTALDRIEVIGMLFLDSSMYDDAQRPGEQVCRIVRHPTGTPTEQGLYRTSVTTPENAVMRRLYKDFDSDPRVTLIGVARGEYAGARFDLARSDAELCERIASGREGHRNVSRHS